MSVRVSMRELDWATVASRLPQAKRAALGIVAATVLADATPKVPMSMRSRGTNLRGSGRARSMADGSAEVEWGGDGRTSRYAGPQHAGHAGGRAFRNYTTPGTGSDWTGKAKAEREGAWRAMFAQELARRLHG